MNRSTVVHPSVTLLEELFTSSGADGFVIGLSGGIDSSVAATLCVRAVGPDRVFGLFLPSAVTPAEDKADVQLLGEFLNISILTVPISPIIDQYRQIPRFIDTPYLVGNLMARTRMTILYYYANATNRLVCGTSNRTEYLLGYCTKFGDNAADVQPIIHLLKHEVWDLARALGIPDRLIQKAPSAGLWQNQTDEAELGLTYQAIDAAIKSLEEHEWKPKNPIEEKVLEKIIRAGHKQMPAPHVKR
jgi:NAD+ synthase